MQTCMPNNSYSYIPVDIVNYIKYKRGLLTITIQDTTPINSALLAANRCHSEFMHLYASVTIVNEGSETSYNSCNHSQKFFESSSNLKIVSPYNFQQIHITT